jgi:hypothetical protein
MNLVVRTLEPYINKFIFAAVSHLPSYWNEDSNTMKLILRHRNLEGISYLPNVKYVRKISSPYQLYLYSVIGTSMVDGTKYSEDE